MVITLLSIIIIYLHVGSLLSSDCYVVDNCRSLLYRQYTLSYMLLHNICFVISGVLVYIWTLIEIYLHLLLKQYHSMLQETLNSSLLILKTSMWVM